MKFHYNLSEKDLVDYFIYKVDADTKRKQRTKLTILIISLFYFFLGLSNIFREKYSIALLFIALSILFYFTISPINKWYTKLFFTKKVRKDLQVHIGRNTNISIEQTKIIVTDDTHTGLQSYLNTDIQKIVQLDRVTLILLQNNECIIVSTETISQPTEFEKVLYDFAKHNDIAIIWKED